jgi:hypothetical protein
MKRSYIAIGVIGLALGGLWYSTGGFHPSGDLAANTLRVSEPLVHENLAVFFVRGPDEVDTTRVVTLQEALERNWAVVHETGSVNTLLVENLSPDHDLFVQSGDMIKGGRQDRVIASDMLLPPTSGQVPVRVHCVEHNRWTGRGAEAASHFEVSDNYAVGNELKVANASGNQTAVWANVTVNQDKLTKSLGVQVNAAASPTSLQLALENPAVQAKIDGYRQALRSAGSKRGVVGAVFVVNGKVSSAELYGSNLLFQKAWPKLLKAASIEALAEKSTGVSPRPPAVEEVEEFLAMGGKAGEATLAINGQQQLSELAQNSSSRNTLAYDFQSLREQEVVQIEGGALTGNQVVQQAARAMGNTQTAGAPSPQPAAQFGRVQHAPDRLNESAANALSNTIHTNPIARPQPIPEPVAFSTLQPLSRTNHNPIQVSGSESTRSPRNLVSAVPFSDLGIIVSPTPTQAVNPDGNRLNTNRVDTGSTLLLESRDAGMKVIHRSYIKK